MKSRKLLVLLLMAGGLASNTKANSDSLNVPPPDTLAGNILIINSFDVTSSKMRKNKKELFRQLTDSLKQFIYEGTPPPTGGKLIVIGDLVPDSPDSDSTIQSIMLQHGASKAIVIKKIDAYFNQTNVEVTKEADGKNRTAYFDICSTITYCLYQSGTKGKDTEILVCEFYTKRNVLSGIFAAGPDIVGKKKDAFEIVRKNALNYLSQETFWK